VFKQALWIVQRFTSSTTLDLADLIADASSQTMVVSLYGDACVAEVARAFGPYKLSHHSGSDKFSIYPTFAAAARGMLQLKTASTSAELYARTLEAHFLRQLEPLVARNTT